MPVSMVRYFWSRPCPRCSGQGRLLILWDKLRDALYLHCEECEWGWWDPAKADAGAVDDAFLTLNTELDSEPPPRGEIERRGWGAFIRGEFED